MEIWHRLRQLWDRVLKPRVDLVDFQVIFEHFQGLLNDNQRAMELIADLGEKSGGNISSIANTSSIVPLNYKTCYSAW